MKKEEFDPTELEKAEKEVFGEEEQPEGKPEEPEPEPQPEPAPEPEPEPEEKEPEEKPEETKEEPEEPEKKEPEEKESKKKGQKKPEPAPPKPAEQKEDIFEEKKAPKKSKKTTAPVPKGATPREEPVKQEIKLPEPEPQPEPKPQPETGTTPSETDQHLFAIRTTVGKEATVAEFLSNRAKMEKLDLASFVVPSTLKGYLLVEALDRDELVKAISGIQHIRGIIQGEVDFSEIIHYLEAKVVKDIPKKALVELVSGPFKGEKAKVVRVDKAKDAITVELIEATVPIPITVKMDAVRVLAKDTSVLQDADITTKKEED